MDKKKHILIKKLRYFKQNNNIEYMYLFGSRASGKIHRWSDVDLIVVSKKFKGEGVIDRSTDLYMKWDLDYPVDFLCYTPEEFNKLKKRVSIVSEAIRTGIKL